MKKSFKDLIKRVVASSIAAIAGAHGTEATPLVTFNESDTDSDKETFSDAGKDLSYKLLLRVNSDNSYDLAGHRSHSSHRSHRSHSSHRSGSSHYSHSSHYSSTTTTSSSSSKSYSISSSSSSASSSYTSPSSYKIKSRTLKNGLYGSDVKQLTDWLVKCEYMDSSHIKKNSSGYVVYDDNVKKAIEKFQKDLGLTVDGEAGTTTLNKLESYANDFKKLGDRELRVGMRGTDVTEMVNYLIDKGYIKRAKATGITLFNTAIEASLINFLNDVGLEWKGKTDSDIVYYIKKKYND